MISRHGFPARLDDERGPFQNGAGLHFDNLREDNGEADAAHSHHGVDFVHPLDFVKQMFLRRVGLALRLQGGDFRNQQVQARQEFVQRRVNESDGRRAAFQYLKNAPEILTLEDQQFIQCLLPVGIVLGENHGLNDRAALALEEHMLRPAEADAFRTEFDSKSRIFGRVGVGADPELAANLIRPAQERPKLAGKTRFLYRHFTRNDFAERPVQRDIVAVLDDLPGGLDREGVRADRDFRTARRRSGYRNHGLREPHGRSCRRAR